MNRTRVERNRTRRLAVLHRTAQALHCVGQFDKETMREVDAARLTPVEDLSAHDIQTIREQAGVSQAMFARYRSVKPKLVSEWERGEKKPSGPSLKLLSIVKARGLSAIA
jgi:putative transcriptional regulator